MDIKEFIAAIQNRPKMYVEEVRLDYLYYLIWGYLGGNLMKGYSDIEKKFQAYFYNYVLEWARKNVDENYERNSLFWHQIIRDVTNTEEEAVDLFFKLSEKFFEGIG